MYLSQGILNPMVTYLAFQRLIHMIHPSSFGQWFKGRKRETVNLGVGSLEEVVLQADVHLLLANWPADHANLIPNRGQKIQVGASPTSKYIGKQGILGPAVIRLVEQSDEVLQLHRVELLPEGLEAENSRGRDIRCTGGEAKGELPNC